tara:strand:+ start:357 stop:500 length:144 start_codon:yes stop_codon:yes gene_type:complete
MNTDLWEAGLKRKKQRDIKRLIDDLRVKYTLALELLAKLERSIEREA